MINNVLKLRLLFLAITLMAVLWLSFMAIVPGGKISYRFDCGSDEFISKMTPKERVNLVNKKCGQEISGNPVYFNLRTSRRFNKSLLKLRYSFVRPVKLFEVGVLADKKIWRYDLRPVQNTLIDNLKWPSLVDKNLTLFQKDKKFNSIADFEKNLPDISRLATYNYDLQYNYLLQGYKATSSKKIFSLPLRGDYQFFTYLKNEELKFNFIFEDLNQNRDPDPVVINLYKDGKLASSESLVDDGEKGDTGKIGKNREFTFEKDGLVEGVYKIQIIANDDIVTKKFFTAQQKLSFAGRLWLSKNNAKNIKLFTDSYKIQAKTVNPDSLQEILVGTEKLDISETYKQFEADVSNGEDKLKIIELKKDGVIISGDGVFAFTEAEYINPKIKKVDENFQEKDFDYVLADYAKPKNKNGIFEQEIEFDMTSAYRENGRYSFLLSVPELRDGSSTAMIVSNLEIELSGRSVWEKLFN